ncbi:MAG: ATP-binding protein [Burkholderiales bacterium]|nr:ATP-binding protein [Burkholderiales bacterium]
MNQRWLAARLAALKARLQARLDGAAGEAEVEAAAEAEAAEAADVGFVPALELCSRCFGLSGFERELLLLAAGVEIDDGLRALRDDRLGGQLTFASALGLLALPHWSAIGPAAPLRHWRLVQWAVGQPAPHAALTVDERVLLFLTGLPAIDARLDGLLSLADRAPAADAPAAERIAALLARGDGVPAILVDGQAGAAARRDSAVAAAHRCKVQALLIAVEDLPGAPAERAETARLVDREAALAEAVVVLWSRLDDRHEAAAAFIDELRCPLVVAGGVERSRLRDGRRAFETVAVGRARAGASPEAAQRVPPAALDEALQQFHVAPCIVDECLARVPAQDPRDPQAPGRALWQALREAARGGLEALAQRIDTETSFDDLVLPAAQSAQLREIAAQLRHRHTVYETWQFARRGTRGLGIAALFAGESGTGKTMAAEAIANACRLDLFRIDLAATVSKYIGETEKNLKRLFDAAEASGAVLLFDEADALFGKRSEVKDSHDRYANIEVAYLLQRIESYRGLAVLTSNMKSALDRAFLRRIRFVVQFPFPDEAARAELWRRQFPAAAPLQGIDCAALAAMPLAGGNLRSIAVNAAFSAAAASGPITQRLVVDAARAEFAKLERAPIAVPGGGR